MSTSMVDTISPRFRPSEQRQRTDTIKDGTITKFRYDPEKASLVSS